MSRPFEEFWELMLAELDRRPPFGPIRNWTADKGYAIGGQFQSSTYRSLVGLQEHLRREFSFPRENPNDVIVCTRVLGDTWAFVQKKDFGDRYERWPSYKRGLTREAFGSPSPYVIALFKEFERLMEATDSQPAING